MERFKDRAWRLFGAKVPLELRPEIKARFQERRRIRNKKWLSRAIGSTLRAHAPLLIENITQDSILFKALGEKDLAPSVFKMKDGA
jgi:hypothetical protein